MHFLTTLLQVVSAVTASFAAFYWSKSAMVPIPDFSVMGRYSPSAASIAPIGEWAMASAALSQKAAMFASGSAAAGALALTLQALTDWWFKV